MQTEESGPGGSKDAGKAAAAATAAAASADNGKATSGETTVEAPPTHGIHAVDVLWTFGKCLGALLPVYLAGYYRFSTSFLVFGMMIYTGWKHAREAKEARHRSAVQLYDDEQEQTSGRVAKSKRDLPAWVLQQVWPFVGQYLEKLLLETIAPAIRGSSSHLQTLSFTKVDMGNKPMKVVGIKAHTENDRGQVLLDLYISYVGDVEINVEVKRYFCKAGVKGIQLHGMMRVILEPLIGDVPIVGAVTMFFIRRPKLVINWTGLTNLLDIPGLNVMSDSMIMDAIASFLVLPNRLTVPLVPDLHGVVRIHLVEADGLPAKDNFIKGMMCGRSDPYALVRVGPQTFTSQHVDNTVCPKWGEIYEVIVHEVPGQELELEVYDKDTDQDDFLGRAKMDFGIVKKSIVVDNWLTLKDTPSGRVHLRLEWLTLLPTTDRLEQVLKRNESVISKTADPPSSAVLVVYLDKAESLPMKKGGKEPNPMVQLSVRDVTRESKICYTTNSPQWEEAFTFFIQDPQKQDVKDSDRVQTLGRLNLPLSRLLTSANMTLDQWFQLDSAGPASRIYIKTVLRVLWLDEEHISAEVSSGVEAGLAKQLPQESTPHPSFATEGLLRIHLLAGQNLVPKDNLMGGLVKGKSDPYVKVNVGGETFTSQVIKGNLNPTWNEMYEVVLTQLPGQDLHVEIFDKDMDMKDDFMGRLKISLKDIIAAQYTDQWYTLNDVKSGRVHFILEWVPMATEPDRLDQVLQFHSKQTYQNKTVPSTALLFVYVEQAHDLPLKKSGKEPKVGAEIVLGKTSHKTTVCERTTAPKWNEAFYFRVRDPREDILVVKLSHSWALPMGSLVVPVRELLSEPDLMLIPSKCPGASVQTKPAPGSDPSGGRETLEADALLRSSSVDVPTPQTTVVPGLVSKRADEQETAAVAAAAVPQEKEQGEEVEEEGEGPPAAPAGPPHTSPDHSFGSESLVAKDNMMGGMVKGKSDPYAKVTMGEHEFKSHVIKEDLNPTWNEMYEVVMKPQSGLEVKVELYDEDMGKDDFLGRLKVSLADIIQSQCTDEWYTLEGVKSGRVRLILEWVPMVSQNTSLDKVLQLQSLWPYQNKAVPSAALLFVYLERAQSLPLKKSGKEPKAGAELVLGHTTHKTKVCDRSKSPEWREAFLFPIRDPREEMLIVKLSSAWDQPMGSLVLPVKELLSEPELVLDQWFYLDGATPESQILLRAELKILNSKLAHVPQESLTDPEDEAVPAVASGDQLIAVEDTVCELPPQDVLVTSQAEAPEEVEPVAVVTRKEEPTLEEEASVVPQMEEPVEEEEPAQEEKEEYQPKSSGPDSLAQATVTGLPPDVVPKPAEITEESRPAVVLQPHTKPSRDFASDGVLRIHLLEAQSLVAKDNMMGGMVKGKSDPYVMVTVGEQHAFKSHVIKENLNPTWNEMYEVVLSAQAGQQIHFEAYDKDLDSDDFLGRFSIMLDDVIRLQYHDQVLQLQSAQTFQNKAVPSAALLFVHVERAHALPHKKSGKEPKAGAELVLGQTTHRTKVCERTSSPQWTEAFYFLVRDPKHEMLIVKLLSEPQLVLDQWFHLDGASPESQILLRAELKILDSKMVDMIIAGTLPCSAADAARNGQVKLTLSSQDGRLIVMVHACRGLSSPGKDAIDGYVSLMLLPDKSKATKKKTAVKKRDLSPEFNERFEYVLTLEEAKRRQLSVSVKDNSASFRGRDVIGQVHLELAEVNLLAGVTEWFDLTDGAD
ncbi:hypothetical protein CRUP_036383 [Coryphaenoides rupestris]|nr:hypothetical protein CRUP_036383 [Coryphaenoides rupestris]